MKLTAKHYEVEGQLFRVWQSAVDSDGKFWEVLIAPDGNASLDRLDASVLAMRQLPPGRLEPDLAQIARDERTMMLHGPRGFGSAN